MSFLKKVEHCNHRDLGGFLPFIVAGMQYGWLTPERAAAVLAFGNVFQPALGGVTLNPTLATAAKRSKALADLTPALVSTGLFQKPRGELYAVRNRWSDRPVFRLDRAFMPAFGLRAYGVHVNGVVRKRDGLHLWIGTRARTLRVEPGKLDNMVAGGQPAGLGLMENLVKECGEEAHIAPRLARTAQAAGVITYCFACPEGLRVDTLFCYDLAMSAAAKPRPSEEIARYRLMPLAKVLQLVKSTTRFKFNVNLVIIDFAIRQGVLGPENTPDYERIVAGLHERPPSIL